MSSKGLLLPSYAGPGAGMSEKMASPEGAGEAVSLYCGGGGLVSCVLKGGQDGGDAGARLGAGHHLKPAPMALHNPFAWSQV